MGIKISQLIPIPYETVEQNLEIKAPVITKNAPAIGVAFDYLLRNELKRSHPDSVEATTVASQSIDIVKNHIALNKKCVLRNKVLHKSDLIKLKELETNYFNARKEFYESGKLTEKFLELTVKFSRLDSIYRAGTYTDFTEEVPMQDIDDLRSLYIIIPEKFKNLGDKWILDMGFGNSSKIVGGADVDLITGNTMIDIKTTKRIKLGDYEWGQLVGYAVLAEIERGNDISFPRIDRLGLYFSRYAYIWTIDSQHIYRNPNYKKVKELILSSGGNFGRLRMDERDHITYYGDEIPDEYKKDFFGTDNTTYGGSIDEFFRKNKEFRR